MPTARLLAHQCRLDDQARGLHEIELFRRALGKPRLDRCEVVEAGAESSFRPVDGGVLPHRAAHIIGGDLRRTAIEQRRHVPGARTRKALKALGSLEIAGDALGEDESLEE